MLVGDDRQFASIQAGGGFRALRLRLGASELTVNRRQVEAWEQQAIEGVPPATSSRRLPPMPSMTASERSRPVTTATGRWLTTGGRRMRPGNNR